jgi:superfamily I DNA/RNA helicase
MTEKTKAKESCPGWKKRILEMPVKKGRNISKSELEHYGFTHDFINRKGNLERFFKFTGKASGLISKVDEIEYKEYFQEPPRVYVGTIHSVKGGESDNVYIDARLSPKIEKTLLHGRNRVNDFNTELRVAYVAATRAKNKLGIMNNPGSLIYERI